MSKLKPDEFHSDGTLLFNPTLPHGLIYGDGKVEGQFMQDGIVYRADRLPVGHTELVKTEPEKKTHWKTLQKQAKESQNGLPGAS